MPLFNATGYLLKGGVNGSFPAEVSVEDSYVTDGREAAICIFKDLRFYASSLKATFNPVSIGFPSDSDPGHSKVYIMFHVSSSGSRWRRMDLDKTVDLTALNKIKTINLKILAKYGDAFLSNSKKEIYINFISGNGKYYASTNKDPDYMLKWVD